MRRTSTLAAAGLLVACAGPDGPTTELGVALTIPGTLAAQVTGVELTVFDALAACDGPDAMGGTAIDVVSLTIGQSTQLHVSTGHRTFLAVALDGSSPVARGCAERDLEAGQTYTIAITLEEYGAGPDGGLDGGPDGGPDASPPPDGAPPDTSCPDPGPLTPGTPVSGTTIGSVDDLDLSCLAAGGPDELYQFTTSSAQAVLVTLAPAGGWGLAAALRDAASCEGGTDLSCAAGADGTRYLNQPNLPAGTWDVIVDGADGATGDYTVEVETAPPDTTFGYWRIDSTGTYTALSGATDVGVVTGGGLDTEADEGVFILPIGFDFPFFGATYPSVSVSSNMFMTFSAVALGPESYDNDCPLDSTAPANAVAPFWDDGYADTGAVLQYKSEGTAPFRRFSVEWQNWDMWHCQTGGMNCNELNTSVTQTAILYENGDIEFRYGPRTAPANPLGCNTQHTGCSATIGIEGNVSGTADVDQKQCNTNGITEGSVVYYVAPR